MLSLLLLDIDGVLNPFYARYSTALTGFEEYLIHNRSFFLNKALQTPFLELVSDTPEVDAVWVSGWEEESNLILNALEVKRHWRHVDFDEVGEGNWKLPTVQRFVAAGEWDQVIWCDDEIEERTLDWAAKSSETVHLIVPDRLVGLTESSYREMTNLLGL